jgi:hypothetical protein
MIEQAQARIADNQVDTGHARVRGKKTERRLGEDGARRSGDADNDDFALRWWHQGQAAPVGLDRMARCFDSATSGARMQAHGAAAERRENIANTA